MSYDGILWKDVDPDLHYESIEDVLMTCCHICGERLEWDIKTTYNSYMDAPTIKGESFSCGVKYMFEYDHVDSCYKIMVYY